MRILLVRPAADTVYMRALYKVINLEPLGLEYVAAGVSDKHEVQILDMTIQEDFDGLSEALTSFDPHIVGTTGYSCESRPVKRVHARAKEFNRDILTVAGGVHATVVTEDFNDPNIEVIVRGQGVFTFKEIDLHSFIRAGGIEVHYIIDSPGRDVVK